MRPHLRNSVLPVSVQLLLLKSMSCVSIHLYDSWCRSWGRWSKGKIWGNSRFHWLCSIQLSFFVTVNWKKNQSLSPASLETLVIDNASSSHPPHSALVLNRFLELHSLLYSSGNSLHTHDSVSESGRMWVEEGEKEEMETAESITFLIMGLIICIYHYCTFHIGQ